MLDYLDLLLYFFFFLGGFMIDFGAKQNRKVRKGYMILMYIFLCFGYMTGSDWRSYEIFYHHSSQTLFYASYEFGFYYFFDYLHYIVPDFWLALALLKIVYLSSVIIILKRLTDKWLSALSLLMPLSLLFMLIDNPLRFMVANIFVNISFYYVLRKKIVYSIIAYIPAPFFQITTIFIIPYLLFILLKDKIVKLNKYELIVIYLIISVLFGFPNEITAKIEDINKWMVLTFNTRSFSSYFVDNNNEVLTIGSLLKLIIALFVFWKKDQIIQYTKYGDVICLYTILYLMIDRILLIVPTGFRLAVPLSILYSVGLLTIIQRQKKDLIKLFLPFVYFLVLSSSLTRGYVYIPYSNSIYYIITEHKPYAERDRYNLDAMKQRTGQEHVHRTKN